ncbi:hypothetical protein JJQ09_23515 [Enterobacter hormaechei]|nr:hypothetical protein [Enterobacter hormaechei]
MEFFFKEPLACIAAIAAVICLVRRVDIGRKPVEYLKPSQSEPEWAEKFNRDTGDEQQRKEIFWRNAVIIFGVLGGVLHFLGK